MVKKGQRINIGIRDKSPCAYCPADEKYTACHDTCKKYKEWRAKLEAVKEARAAYYRENWRKKWGRTIIWHGKE